MCAKPLLQYKHPVICIVTFLLVMVFVCLAWPVNVPCGAPQNTCAMPPDSNGNVTWSYSIEPLAIAWLEEHIRTDLPVQYTSGTVSEKIPGYETTP